MRITAPAWLPVALLFTVLSVAATWPQALEPGAIPSNQDAWLNMWRLAWVAHQLPRDPLHLFDANIYYPERATLAYSDATLLQALLVSPLIWLGVPVPYALTMLVLGSFVFAGVAAWALVRQLTGSSRAGIVAGVIFAFTPYRFDHYMHLELLWTGWMPLVLMAVHRTLERGSIKAGVAAGLLFAAQAFSCVYYAVLFAPVLAVFCGVLGFGLSRTALRRAAIALACGGLIAGALLMPYLVPYRQARAVVGERSTEEAMVYSARPSDYLAPTPDNLLYGSLGDRAGRHEKCLFPGLLAIGLAMMALWPPLTRERAAYLAALLLAIDVSFGPVGLTYDWLREYILPFRGLRAVARAAGVVLLMIAVLAGFGWARLERSGWLVSRLRSRVAFAAALAVMAVEYATTPRSLVAAPTKAELVYQWLAARTDGGAVIELPMPGEFDPPLHEPEFMYRSTFHWHPIVNGYSGYAPKSYKALLRLLRTFPTDTGLDRLKEIRVRYIVVHERLFGTAAYRDLTMALYARPDLVRHGPFGKRGEESTVYVLIRRPVR